ncbi:MAG: anthranilate synthase component I [Candidatus Nanohaloarchaea archaeon]
MTEFDLSEEEFRDRAGPGKVVRLEAPLDIDEDPLQVYSALSTDYSFLLESAEKEISEIKQADAGDTGDRNRYSFIGFDPEAVLTVNDREVEFRRLGGEDIELPGVGPDGRIKDDRDTLDVIREAFPDRTPDGFEESGRQVFSGGLVGFLAYDVVNDLWIDRESESETPDARFVLSTRNIVFDHREDEVRLVVLPMVDEDPGEAYREAEELLDEVERKVEDHEPDFREGFRILDHSSGDREPHAEMVEEAGEHILEGDIFQAVLSRKHEIEVRGDVREYYEKLRELNPSPYMYLLEFDGFSVAGSSPETLLSVDDGKLSTNPIAGTVGRGENAVEDRRLAGQMLSDEKELAEHSMLVDLGRNDVRRVSKPGTIELEELMSVVQYSHVQHMESTVTGQLREGKDAFDATRSIFPAGTLSGAPKIRAMKIIDRLEQSPRGVYGGGVGYYSWNSSSSGSGKLVDCDLAITIRTASFRHIGDRKLMTVQAGGGIVADSEPEKEFEETEKKMGALLDTLEELEVEE